jgi:hypothetical protein
MSDSVVLATHQNGRHNGQELVRLILDEKKTGNDM